MTHRFRALWPLLLALTALFVNPILPQAGAWTAAFKVMTGYGAILFAPGLALSFLAAPEREEPFIRIGLAAAASFIMVQALCTLAITFHLPSALLTAWLLKATIPLSAAALFRRAIEPDASSCRTSTRLALCVTAITAVPLYLEGGIAAAAWHPTLPVLNWEDTMHVGIAQRLATEAAPNLFNIFLYPNTPYVYPFPGTHYLFAMVSHAAALDDVMFVYDKARPIFWLISVAAYWGLALAMSGRKEIADFLPVVFSLGLLTGALGRVSHYFIGQVAPLSHAAEVAGEVWLPLLLMVSVRVASPGLRSRQTALHAGLALCLAASLIIIHPREVVQFLVYSAMMAASFFLVSRDRRGALIHGALAVAVAIALLLYLRWHSGQAQALSAIIADGRQAFLTFIRQMPWWRFVLPLDPAYQYVYGLHTLTLAGLNGVLLLIFPTLLWRYRRQPAMVMAGLSTAGYLLVSSIGTLSIIAILLTNDEMLMVPVRNWHIFLRVVLVIAVFEIVCRARQLCWKCLLLLCLALAVGSLACRLLEGAYYGWLLFPALLTMSGVASSLVRDGLRAPLASTPAPLAPFESKGRLLMVAAAICAGGGTVGSSALAGWAWWADAAQPGGRARQLLAGESKAVADWRQERGLRIAGECLEGDGGKSLNAYSPGQGLPPLKHCYPDADLMDWGRRSLAPDSVMAVNVFNAFSPQPFWPVQLAAPPYLRRHGIGLRNIPLQLPVMAEEFRRLPAGAHQPIFNDTQDEVDIRRTIDRLGVTHILLDPMYAELRPRFLGFRWLTEIRRSGQWTVFAVTEGSRS